MWNRFPQGFPSVPCPGPIQSPCLPPPHSLALKGALCTDHEGGLGGLSSGPPGFDSLPPLCFHSLSVSWQFFLCRCRSLFSWLLAWHQRISGKKGFSSWTSLPSEPDILPVHHPERPLHAARGQGRSGLVVPNSNLMFVTRRSGDEELSGE